MYTESSFPLAVGSLLSKIEDKIHSVHMMQKGYEPSLLNHPNKRMTSRVTAFSSPGSVSVLLNSEGPISKKPFSNMHCSVGLFWDLRLCVMHANRKLAGL